MNIWYRQSASNDKGTFHKSKIRNDNSENDNTFVCVSGWVLEREREREREKEIKRERERERKREREKEREREGEREKEGKRGRERGRDINRERFGIENNSFGKSAIM